MRRGHYQRRSSSRFPVAVLIAVMTLIITFAIIICKACNDTQIDLTEKEDLTEPIVEKNPNSIAIPGYEMLELKADSKEQSLCMPNPPQNCCYFQISLYMEDGTLLWQSELIEPGANSKPMVLSMALEKGMYPNAVLRYSCYSQDENLTPLNGAETKLTLWVK